MISLSKGQIVAIVSAVALAVVIMLLPKTVPFDTEVQNVTVDDGKEKIEMQIAEGIGSVLQSEAPMQGIMILRQVLKKEPGNIKANLALAVFSVMSGQRDKALERFKQVVDAEHKDEGAAKFLAQVYAQEGKIDMIIGPMTAYRAVVEDPAIQKKVDDIINELNNI